MPPRLNLGRVLLAKADPAGAAEAFRGATQLDQNSVAGHYLLGVSLQATGDLDGAIVSFRNALRLEPERDPNFAAVHNDLAWLLATGPDGVRDSKLAVEHAARACELTGGKAPSFLDTLAAAYAEAGEFDSAIKYEERALAHPAFEKADGKGARERLGLYKKKKSFRDPSLAPRAVAPSPREVKK